MKSLEAITVEDMVAGNSDEVVEVIVSPEKKKKREVYSRNRVKTNRENTDDVINPENSISVNVYCSDKSDIVNFSIESIGETDSPVVVDQNSCNDITQSSSIKELSPNLQDVNQLSST